MGKNKITKLEPKGNILIVGIEGQPDHTMNKGWQAQEIDFLMKDVGVGGTFEGTLFDKEGKDNKIYHNIKDINMESYTKGNDVEVIKIKDGETPIREDVGKSIVAQCLTKAYCTATPVDVDKEHVLNAYKYFLENL